MLEVKYSLRVMFRRQTSFVKCNKNDIISVDCRIFTKSVSLCAVVIIREFNVTLDERFYHYPCILLPFRFCSLYVVVRPSVYRLSVTFAHPTQAIEIFGNVSTP